MASAARSTQSSGWMLVTETVLPLRARRSRRLQSATMGGRGRWTWLRDLHLSEQELADRGIGALDELGRNDSLWPGQLATLAALGLYLSLPARLTIGPRWPLPVAGLLVVAALVIA